ncbi:plasmid pRiA4b ORF-3 family protein [Clostridium sp. D2Q-11]|uniref:Plasmid pRiA4b ORF-3 family protein n=1 Tax=Anaeromonas frigoriresistens TaxID=2683708 RepID=A0A942UW28_9FIRM|nr:plasmid pRiA4b ORF-3 family protein [Anaeromonas frigoriresistens]MBS4537874.1 plasmid pRiA4b ORF-3 family protein [Anaeromonas frigoriresistens]
MLIQCTKKLLDELKVKPKLNNENDPIFSWHGNILTLNRRKTVVLVNDKSRYVIVLHGLKAKDFKNFDDIFLQAIRDAFKNEYIKDDVIEEYIERSKGISYSKTSGRTFVGRLNEVCYNAKYFEDLLDNNSIYQKDLSKRLSRDIVSDKKKKYIVPNEELYKNLNELTGKELFSIRAVKLKVTLDLEELSAIRRIIMPLDMTFRQFHKILQTIFEWEDYHNYEFLIFDGYEPLINIVSDEDELDVPVGMPVKLDKYENLSDYIDKYKRIKYIYDYGDEWEHYIEVEEVIDDFNNNHPVCIEGSGEAPPEDVGGYPGYREFLSIISDENHPNHSEMKSWGIMQGYKEFNIDMMNRKLKYDL